MRRQWTRHYFQAEEKMLTAVSFAQVAINNTNSHCRFTRSLNENMTGQCCPLLMLSEDSPCAICDRNHHLLTSSEAAEFLRVKPNTLAKYRMTGEGPVYIRQSARRILYRQDDLDAWLNKRSFRSTAAATVSGI